MKASYGWVEEALDRQGKTQSALAKATGINPTRLSKLCKGTYKSMRADELAKVRAFFGYGDHTAGQETAEQYRNLELKHRELLRRVRDLPSHIDRLRGSGGSYDDGVVAAAGLVEGLFPLAE